MEYFGDSFDIVKMSLLHWLSSFGKWSIHPMFTECVTDAQVTAYERLLGANIVSKEILTPDKDRNAYFEDCSHCDHLFLDPDTGLKMRPVIGAKSRDYLFLPDLVGLFDRRRKSLTLVFDKSLARGSEREGLNRKLTELHRHGVFGFAYVSHACFVFTSRERSLLEQVREGVIKSSGLPRTRFLDIPQA